MQIHELSAEYNQLFADFDRINNIENELTEIGAGIFADAYGNTVTDVATYKQELLAAWYDTLEGMEGEIEARLLNIGCYSEDCEASAKALGDKIKQLTARKKALENKAASLKNYILLNMVHLNRNKIYDDRIVLTKNAPREKIVLTDEAAFITWAQENNHDELLTYKKPDISKTAIKNAMEQGKEIPFVRVEANPSLTIK